MTDETLKLTVVGVAISGVGKAKREQLKRKAVRENKDPDVYITADATKRKKKKKKGGMVS